VIAILDYGAGNVGSVLKAFEHLRAPARVVSAPKELAHASQIVLPGQGHFGAMMKGLRERELIEPLRDAIAQGKPFLGICLGLQALYESSEEAPGERGLGLLRGRVQRFEGIFKVPHVGWNKIEIARDDGILRGIANGSFVYFCHSYYAPVSPESSATTEYGQRFTAAAEFVLAAQAGSIAAVQFHPEKSGEVGLTVLRNFLER
jgi:imidazole glycerol phosphate synthase glutamine amidotransferase subunit